MKIVIVEDDVMYQKSLQHQLKNKLTNAEIEVYESGEKMLLFLNPNNIPDVIILDYFLEANPYSVNGYEILKALRNMVPDTKVIMVTGGTGEDYEERFKKAGAHGFIVKGKNTVSEILELIQ